MKNRALLTALGLLLACESITADNTRESNAESCETWDSCCDPGRFFVGAEWLYWKTEQSKMEFGANVDQVVTAAGVDVTSKIIAPQFSYQSGVRALAGYETADQEWAFTASFVYAPGKGRSTTFDNPALMMDMVSVFNVNFPILTALQGTPLDTISGVWDVDNYYLDLDVLRNFSFCNKIQLSPHIGLRVLWSDQTFDLAGAGATAGVSFTSRLKEQITGVGLEGGLWGTVDLVRGFSLVGHLGGSLLYSELRNSGSLAVDNGTLLNVNYRYNTHQNLAMFDSLIGLQYITECYAKPITLFLGWEQHLIFETNQFSVNGGGNMSLQGLTLGGAIAF